MLFISPVRHRVDTDSAWWHENANGLYVFWLHQFSKVLHNHVNTVFVEITVVAKREEIEFKRLALYHFLTRDVVNDDLREIRLTPSNSLLFLAIISIKNLTIKIFFPL